jgi:hypothetical protein
MSSLAHVNYYRCNTCGHVWTTDQQTGELLSDITVRNKQREDETKQC